MIGEGAVSQFIDGIFGNVVTGISAVFNFLIRGLFYHRMIAFFIAYVVINWIAIILMKKDKEYAETPGAKRIRERTLLITAFVGGAFGEYYAMYRYKHKTLHKKFIYGVPLAMVLHFALLSYHILIGILA